MSYMRIVIVKFIINILTINAYCGSICSNTLYNTEIISRQIDTNFKAILELKITLNKLLKLSTSPSPPNPPLMPPFPSIPPFPVIPPLSPPLPYLINYNSTKLLNFIELFLLLFIIIISTTFYKILYIYSCYKVNSNNKKNSEKQYSIVNYFNNKKYFDTSENDLV
jgi:hypothetical protein